MATTKTENKTKRKYTVEDLRRKGLILLEYVSGSQMYGTNGPASDIDIKGIFLLPNEDFSDLNFSPDWEEVETGKFIFPEWYYHDQESFNKFEGKECEMKFYELRKFLQMLAKNNPNSLEIFDIPEDCIIYKHPIIDALLLNQKKFITKKSFLSFSSYAMEQTAKAHGKNKKQNWDKERFERKTILDFCYVPWKQGTIPVKQWLQEVDEIKGMDQSEFGLVKLPHTHNNYGIYVGQGCRGMTNENESSTSLRTSEVPLEARPLTTLMFNESAWMIHCDEYKSYQTWQKEKNEARWVDVKGHDQKIDGKNMLHMQRLLNMATDIALAKGIVSRRPEAADLLKIRKGEVSLQELLDSSEQKVKELKALFDLAYLPEEVEPGLCERINNGIRKNFNWKE